jgi:hypothetical protein
VEEPTTRHRAGRADMRSDDDGTAGRQGDEEG